MCVVAVTDGGGVGDDDNDDNDHGSHGHGGCDVPEDGNVVVAVMHYLIVNDG